MKKASSYKGDTQTSIERKHEEANQIHFSPSNKRGKRISLSDSDGFILHPFGADGHDSRRLLGWLDVFCIAIDIWFWGLFDQCARMLDI